MPKTRLVLGARAPLGLVRMFNDLREGLSGTIHVQVMSKLWLSNEQEIYKSLTSNEQIID